MPVTWVISSQQQQAKVCAYSLPHPEADLSVCERERLVSELATLSAQFT